MARGPSVAELEAQWPDHFSAVVSELERVVDGGRPGALSAYLQRLSDPSGSGGRGGRVKQAEALGAAQVRLHIAKALLERMSLAAATGVSSGTVRFSLTSGSVLQRLLFSGGGLDRKAVSMRAYKALWPRVPEAQRRRLMPLVQPKGIFCFYSRPLVGALASIVDGRAAVEIAAGDGTLSRLLGEAGCPVIATDDHSWPGITFPSSVVREDAATALATRSPEVVLCSWPPARNRFERLVFTTPSVQTYVVLLSRHEFASGDWAGYRAARGFTMEELAELSALVLPADVDPLVLRFERE